MTPLARLIGACNRARCWQRPTRVWGFTLTPPTFDRWLYLQLHRWGRMGRQEKARFEARLQPGMQVVDVGANLGLYALLLARQVGPTGRVFAFEPEPLLAAALRTNVRANGADQVEIFPQAAGARRGGATLYRGLLNAGDNRLWAEARGARRAAETVAVVTLDDALRGRRIDFVKIDVQGWEAQVLRGMGELVQANPQLQVCLEFWPQGLRAAGDSPRELQNALAALGLRAAPLEGGLDKAGPDLEVLAGTMKAGTYCNLLAGRP